MLLEFSSKNIVYLFKKSSDSILMGNDCYINALLLKTHDKKTILML